VLTFFLYINLALYAFSYNLSHLGIFESSSDQSEYWWWTKRLSILCYLWWYF